MALTGEMSVLAIKDNKSFCMDVNYDESIQNIVLVANNAQNFTLADWVDDDSKAVKIMDFACTGVFYVGWNKSNIAVPSVNVVNGTGVELSPATRSLPADITTMSIVAPANCVLVIKLYTGAV